MIRHLITLVLTCSALLLAAGAAHAAVDVNKASRAELETVKGIGPALSGKILQARDSGSFKSWDDLVDRVGGVGPGNAARFSQAGLTVAGASFDGQVPTTTGAAKSAGKSAPKSDKSTDAAADRKPRRAAAEGMTR